MGWKNLPTWLKGGIIGLVIGILFDLIEFVFSYSYNSPSYFSLALSAALSFFRSLFLPISVLGILWGVVVGILMANWNKIPKWLRGGIIGLAIGFLFLFSSLYFSLVCNISADPATGINTPKFCPSNFDETSDKIIAISIIMINASTYLLLLSSFIIGALIGLIIGKFKSKNKHEIKINKKVEKMKR